MDAATEAKTKILVVEDNPLNRELVVDLLEAEGYTVLQAGDSVAFLERVKQEEPHLILLDLQLPGVDGLTLARQLTADPATRRIPVLATTAYAQAGDQERALALGCVGYLPKPLDTKGLVEIVRSVLRRWALAGAPIVGNVEGEK
ncbi:MAG: response regulator [candidate division NC10 bacterium]|nr:response regulator [candidate division NC10 bacterium]